MNIAIGFDPTFFTAGPFAFGWHGLFSALAVGVSLDIGWRLARRRGLGTDTLNGVIVWAMVGGVIGARLFHVLDHWDFYALHPLEALAIWTGGIAVYGSFIGGLLGGAIAAWRGRLPIWRLLDVAAPAMLVGQIIGRLGCLSNGDAWGGPCLHPVGLCLVYLNPDDLLPPSLLGVPTYPYPLYEMAATALLLVGLGLGRKRLGQPGQTFCWAAVGYGLIRFLLTFLRQERQVLWGLQEAQLVAVATIVIVVPLAWWRAAHRPARHPAPSPAAS